MRSKRARALFIYWGRRGLTRFALDVARAALANPNLAASISVSRQNENFAGFQQLRDAVLPVDTFSTNSGALLHAWRIPLIRRQVLRHIASHKPDVAIELMPHVWSSFVAPAIKAGGVRYVPIIHDASAHPGDYRSALVEWPTKRTLCQADLILTLSAHVATRIRAGGWVKHDKIYPLFHPVLDFGARHTLKPPRRGEPWRFLFFGRIMPYKGLPVFLDMAEELRSQGLAVEVGVYGEGNLGASAARLKAMGAEIVNRWLTEAEIAELLPRFHAIVLSHVEASQSGVAAAAQGACLPVIAAPVGGLIEQVEDEVTGVIAANVSAGALAEAAKRLMLDRSLYSVICHNLVARKQDRSVAHFVEQCVSQALEAV